MSPGNSDLDKLRIDRSREPQRRYWPWMLLGLLVVLVVLGVAGWTFSRPNLVSVRATTVLETGGGDRATALNASGYVTARRQATVSSKVTGKFTEVLVEEGMKVEQDQVLARLDDANAQANLHLALAQLAATKSALVEIEVRLHEAKRDLQRISALAKNQIASQAESDQAEAEVKSMQARLERQQSEVTVAGRQVDLWRQQLEDTVIRAPFAGIVVTKNAQPGEMISPMSAGGGFTRTGICTVVDMKSLEIEVDVNESFINRVEPAQKVIATLDAYPDWKIPTKVIAIVPTADRQKATVKVRIEFEKLDPRILPEMGVKVAFHHQESAAAEKRSVTIPKAAVRRQQDTDFVWVLHGGRVEKRAVKLGISKGDQIPVMAGLTGGEKVIVEGPANLADGDRVEERNR